MYVYDSQWFGLAALNVTIPVIVPTELLDTIPLNADDPALLTENPIDTKDFFPVEQSAIEKRDLAGLFGLSASRGPFANFLQIVTKIFINATKKIIKWTCPQFPRPTPNTFPGWRNYKSNDYFRTNAPSAIDEDSFCKDLGKSACGRLLEKRYTEYITNKDIDNFASFGVNTLRIPIGYWAYMPAIAGDNYYTGGQLAAMKRIAQYAITKHNVHIVVELHGLPGGQNGLDNQGKTGQLTWWNNQTNFDLSMEMLYTTLAKPQTRSPTSKNTTPPPCKPSARSPRLPIAISDGFIGPQTWNPYWNNADPYIVIDTHIYFFVGGSYSYDAAYGANYLAKSYGASTNPVFIVEWSIQATLHNHLGDNTRRDFYRGQFQAYSKYLNGGMFWNGKHAGDAVVGEDGSQQKYYWSWEILASEGIVPKPGDQIQSLC
ncbi:hypothetical protein Q7P35_007259 [Cladosporium inversicolor]